MPTLEGGRPDDEDGEDEGEGEDEAMIYDVEQDEREVGRSGQGTECRC